MAGVNHPSAGVSFPTITLAINHFVDWHQTQEW
jgi:hypothetical protein